MKRIVIAISSFTLFIFIAINMLLGNLDSFDNFIFNLAHSMNGAFFDIFFRIITNAGNVTFLIGLSIVLMLYFKKDKFRHWIGFNLIWAGILSQVLKFMFLRERPDILEVERGGYSFPSAHSLLAFAFYGLLIYLINTKTNWSKQIKWLVNIGLGLLILLVGISRVYLGYHFASDVIAAFLIALAYLSIFILIIERKE